MTDNYRVQCGDKVLITMHYVKANNDENTNTIFDILGFDICLDGEVGSLEYVYDGLTPKMILQDWLYAYIDEKGLDLAYMINLERSPEARIIIVRQNGSRITESMTLNEAIEKYMRENPDAVYMI